MYVDEARFEALAALGLGFAFAGLLATGVELALRGPVGIRQLQTGGIRALASIPVLLFSAPFVILRALVRDGRARRQPVGYVLLATVLAGGWSLLSGRLVFDVVLRLSGA